MLLLLRLLLLPTCLTASGSPDHKRQAFSNARIAHKPTHRYNGAYCVGNGAFGLVGNQQYDQCGRFCSIRCPSHSGETFCLTTFCLTSPHCLLAPLSAHCLIKC